MAQEEHVSGPWGRREHGVFEEQEEGSQSGWEPGAARGSMTTDKEGFLGPNKRGLQWDAIEGLSR